jgi:glutamate-ammonia-ligase adenylyltransferase
MKDTPETGLIADLTRSPIRAPSQAAAKSVAADLKPLAADHPEIAAILGSAGRRAIFFWQRWRCRPICAKPR